MTRLQAPEDGVAVRMYRQGHGDCFLLAFPRKEGGEPVYVLIDCGYKPGSPRFVHDKSSSEIVDHIGKATARTIDLMIVTHEHQDHVNAIWKKGKPYFDPLNIQEAWLAWTEDPEDELAETLRRRHRDQLLGLVEARQRLTLAVGEGHGSVRRLDRLLSFEIGGESEEAPNLAASDPTKSVNKQAIKLVKDKAAANRGVRYLSPGGAPLEVPGTDGVRAFVLGPPRSEDLLEDEDPVGGEGFPTDPSQAHGLSFRAAVSADGCCAPFPSRFQVPLNDGLDQEFFRTHYGKGDDPAIVKDKSEVASDAAWRRIDDEWLHSAESLALKLNRGINNTSLVLAFELPKSRKVLLFIGDAQRGNWISWTDHTWIDDGKTVTARDLLARTILYKVGHHGSHNATLAGRETDDYPNLAWMGRDVPQAEFCAMVTAVRKWAMTENSPPWNHPLPSISAALMAKAGGRVLQTDIDVPVKPDTVSAAAWKRFTDRLTTNDFCFDLVFPDQ